MTFDRDAFERKKRQSVGQLLFKAARLWNERAVATLKRRPGSEDVRMAHTALLPHLELEGIRLTELAKRAGMSKQAAGQLVAELEAMGILERRDDPSDGRAKLVCFTEKGKRSLLEGLALLGAIEAEVARTLGDKRMRELGKTLNDLIASFGDLDQHS